VHVDDEQVSPDAPQRLQRLVRIGHGQRVIPFARQPRLERRSARQNSIDDEYDGHVELLR